MGPHTQCMVPRYYLWVGDWVNGGRVGGLKPFVSSYFDCYFAISSAVVCLPLAKWQKYDSRMDFVNSRRG